MGLLRSDWWLGIAGFGGLDLMSLRVALRVCFCGCRFCWLLLLVLRVLGWWVWPLVLWVCLPLLVVWMLVCGCCLTIVVVVQVKLFDFGIWV